MITTLPVAVMMPVSLFDEMVSAVNSTGAPPASWAAEVSWAAEGVGLEMVISETDRTIATARIMPPLLGIDGRGRGAGVRELVIGYPRIVGGDISGRPL